MFKKILKALEMTMNVLFYAKNDSVDSMVDKMFEKVKWYSAATIGYGCVFEVKKKIVTTNENRDIHFTRNTIFLVCLLYKLKLWYFVLANEIQCKALKQVGLTKSNLLTTNFSI